MPWPWRPRAAPAGAPLVRARLAGRAPSIMRRVIPAATAWSTRMRPCCRRAIAANSRSNMRHIQASRCDNNEIPGRVRSGLGGYASVAGAHRAQQGVPVGPLAVAQQHGHVEPPELLVEAEGDP